MNLRALAVILGVLAAAGAIGVVVFAQIGMLDHGLALPWLLFADANPIAKLVLMGCALAVIALLLLGLPGLLSRKLSPNDMFTTLAYAAPGVTLLAAGYLALNIAIAVDHLDPPLRVFAPSVAEVLLVLTAGFLTGALAAAFGALAARPAQA